MAMTQARAAELRRNWMVFARNDYGLEEEIEADLKFVKQAFACENFPLLLRQERELREQMADELQRHGATACNQPFSRYRKAEARQFAVAGQLDYLARIGAPNSTHEELALLGF